MAHLRLYSKDYVDSVLAFFTTNLPGELTQYEVDHPGITIDSLIHLDIIDYHDKQTPYGVLYEMHPAYDMITLHTVEAQIDMSIDFKDTRADLDQLRNNLYAYRDGIVNLLKNNPDLMGIVTECDITDVKPPLVMKEAANYSGIIEVNFKIKFE